MEKKCIGIDVGGTTVKIGIFETDGTLEPQGREWGVHSSGCSRFDQEEIERAGNPDGRRDRRRHGISGTGAAGRLCGGLRQLRMARSEPAEDFE